MILQRKVFPASHSGPDVIRATGEKLISILWYLWCPVHSSAINHPKVLEIRLPSEKMQDGYLPLAPFLLLIFQCCFYFTKSGPETILSLDYTHIPNSFVNVKVVLIKG